MRRSVSGAIASFLRGREGVVAVEMALLAIPIVLMLVAVAEIGLYFYVRNSLDYAAQQVSRQIMTGAVQAMTINNQPLNASQFQSTVVCPKLPRIVVCSSLIVNVQTFAEGESPGGFYQFVNSSQSGLILPTPGATPPTTSYCIGASGQYVVLQFVYPLPLITSIFSSGSEVMSNGKHDFVFSSTAAWKNEPFPPGYVPPAGC